MSAKIEELEAQLRKQRDLEQNLTFRFSIVNKILEAQVLKLIQATPLNLTGYRLLRVAGIFEAISVSELSRQMLVDRALISRTAIELEGLGLINSGTDPNSKRKKILRLSEQGKLLMANLEPKFKERQKLVDDTVGEDAIGGLWQALENLSKLQ